MKTILSPLLLLTCALSSAALARDYPAEIVRAIDGDTVVANVSLGMRVELKLIHVRLRDIDAPERGTEAGEAARKLAVAFAAGKKAILRTDDRDEFDKYGRMLASVEVGGKDLATELRRANLMK